MTKVTRGSGRVSFLTVRNEIETDLKAGHSYRSTYDRLKPQLEIGYQAFAKYVVRYIGQVPASKPRLKPQPSASARVTPQRDADVRHERLASEPQPVQQKTSRLVFNNSPSREWVKEQLSRPKPKEG